MAARSLALAGAAVLSVASLSGAAAANTAPAPTITFLSGSATFKVGGHTWSVSVSSFTAHSSGIEIATTHQDAFWSFFPASSPLTVNQQTGDATFNSHNSFAPVASVKLKFTTTKRHKASCTSGSETDFSGNVSGSLTLIANNSGLKFQSAHVRFTGGSLTVDHNCKMPTPASPCGPGIWSIGSNTVNVNGTSSALPGQRTYVASVFENVNLKAPKNAVLDVGVVGNTNKPVFNSSKKTLQASARGVVSGSVLFKATGAPHVDTSNCVLGGKHFKERAATYSANFASPKGREFQARSSVVGLLKAPRSGSSFFVIVSLKPA